MADLQVTPAPRVHAGHRLQFSLKTMLLVVFAFACCLGWLGAEVERKRTERRIVGELKKLDGFVGYDWQAAGRREPPGPRWLRGLLGNDFFATVVKAECNSRRMTDSELELLSRLRSLRILVIRHAAVTDRGIAHLGRLESLQHLVLRGTPLSDAGLAHLGRMTRLRTLDLAGSHVTDHGLMHVACLAALRQIGLSRTHVTDAGVQALQAALPDCRIERRLPLADTTE